MRRQRRTFFLLVSAVVFVLGTDVLKVYGKQDETIGVQAETDAQDEIINVQAEITDIQPEINEAAPETNGVQAETSDVQTEVTDMQPGTGDVQAEAIDMQSGTGDVQAEAIDMQSGTGDVQAEAIDMQSGTGDAQAEAIDMQSGTGDVQTEVAEIQPETVTPSLFPDNLQGVLFIGDSRTVGLYEYGQPGESGAFASVGMTVFNLWDREVSFGGQGKKTLEQVLAQNQYQVIHLMLGINELGYPLEQIIAKYGETVGKIRKMQPNAVVVLGANLHVTASKAANDAIFNNQRINELNGEIQKLGAELGCHYIDVNVIFDDAMGNLSEEYSADGIHMLGQYCTDWTQWIQSL